MTEFERFRDNPSIDPALHIWGWEIPVYLFLGGVAAGVMMLSALLWLRDDSQPASRWSRFLPWAAPVLITAGMLALLLDLAYPRHVHRFYLALRPLSPMSWGSWILIGIYPASLLFGLAVVGEASCERACNFGPLRRLRLARLVLPVQHWAGPRMRQLALANLVFGAALGAYTGLLLGTLAARPAWNSTMLAPLFLVSGLSTGAAFMLLFPLADHEHSRIRDWDLWALAAEFVALGLFLLSLFSSGRAEATAAVERLTTGSYAPAFWTLVVGSGLVVPLLLEYLEKRRSLRPTVMAPALILAGGLSLRWIIVLAGQAS